MNPDRLEEFTNSWVGFPPEQTKDCPTNEILIEWANERDASKWDNHAKSCPHCSSVLRLLQRTNEPGSKLQAFLEFTGSQRPTPAQQSSARAYLRALFSVHRPQWITATVLFAVSVSALFLVARWGVFHRPSYQPETVTLPKDIGADQIRLAAAQLDELRNSSPTELADLNQRIADYNQIDKTFVDTQHQLQPEQKQRLKDLLTQTYSELSIKQAQFTAARTSSMKEPEIPTKPPEHEQFASLYAKVDRAVSKKNESSDKPQTELEQAFAVKSASQQIAILPETTGTEMTILDRIPDRPSSERNALINGITAWSNETKIVVNFKSPSGTTRIVPAGASAFSGPRQ